MIPISDGGVTCGGGPPGVVALHVVLSGGA